ncbi:MAG: SDR family oxidoreductase [Pseudomonadales bacterium]
MSESEVALIVGGGPGISASCARLFADQGLQVAIAARDITKPSLQLLAEQQAVQLVSCDASDPDSVAHLFTTVTQILGTPRLVIHNIDGRSQGVFRKAITEIEPELVLATIKNSTYSAFLVGQQAARHMLAEDPPAPGRHRGSIIFTNASAALKGFALSGAFAAASQGKAGLAQSMARELMPQGIHVAQVPIDAAIGVPQPDGSRRHWLAGETVDDNMADPDRIAEVYWQLHQQHPSTWTFEMALRPWSESW